MPPLHARVECDFVRAVRRFALSLLLLNGCTRDFVAPTDTVLLPIADRQWDAAAPAEGWCGEASLQMAASHFGGWVPQQVANTLGQPKTPDLWEHDIPTALRALRMRFERGPSSKPARLLPWLVEALRRGHPVVLGLKLVPTTNPQWHVDHLVLAVGFTPAGLTVNTNLEDGQVTLNWADLQRAEGSHGYSLLNQSGELFAFSVSGFYEPSPLPVRLDVAEEQPGAVTVDVVLEGLHEGTSYELLRDGVPLEVFTAKRPTRTLRTVVAGDAVVRFSARTTDLVK